MNESREEITRIGFVGLGNMGWPMAHLLDTNYTLKVHDAQTELAASFAAEHRATATTSLREIGEHSDAVITMLPNGDIVREVTLGSRDGLIGGMKAGSVLIDMSSSAPLGTRQLGKDLQDHNISLVDAPVSGGVVGAQKGSLSIMAGGEADQVARCRPVLEQLGRAIYEMGASGTGHTMKALNNYCSAVGLSAACEALIVGDRMGLDPAQMIDVLNSSSGRNANTEGQVAQDILNRSFNVGFTVGLMAKDVGIAAGVSEALSMETPILTSTRNLWRDAEQLLGGSASVAEVVKLWEEWNNRELGTGPE
tara:strand:+ start:210 stop:1133 length:924 start_codon:yes stop_codon:yes gene_type:complete